MSARTVLGILSYENFVSDFEAAFLEMNKGDGA